MVETLRHKEAFEYYYSLGEKRSITDVALKYNVSRGAVAKWSIAFSWQERIRLRDIENGKTLEKKTDKKVVDRKADLLKVAEHAIFARGHFAERLQKGEVKIDNITEFDRLSKLILLLMGESTERGDLTIDDNTSEERIRRRMAVTAARIRTEATDVKMDKKGLGSD